METAGMAGAKNVFDQNLRLLKIRFIPACPARQGVDLNPVVSYFLAFLPDPGHPLPLLFNSETLKLMQVCSRIKFEYRNPKFETKFKIPMCVSNASEKGLCWQHCLLAETRGERQGLHGSYFIFHEII
jgi:hypothetical protein